jgi:hypothetical protein
MAALTVARITPNDHGDWLSLFQQWHHYLSGSVPIANLDELGNCSVMRSRDFSALLHEWKEEKVLGMSMRALPPSHGPAVRSFTFKTCL